MPLPSIPVAFDIFCPSCRASLLVVADGVVTCVNGYCENYRVRYAVPAVELRRLERQYERRLGDFRPGDAELSDADLNARKSS